MLLLREWSARHLKNVWWGQRECQLLQKRTQMATGHGQSQTSPIWNGHIHHAFIQRTVRMNWLRLQLSKLRRVKLKKPTAETVFWYGAMIPLLALCGLGFLLTMILAVRS